MLSYNHLVTLILQYTGIKPLIMHKILSHAVFISDDDDE